MEIFKEGKSMLSIRTATLALTLSFGLAACSGGGSGSPPAPPAKTASASVVVATTPPNGAMGVSLGSSIQALFSEPMDPASISSLTLTVFAAATPSLIELGGTVSYDPATQTATFAPNGLLASKTLYTATLGSGILDAAGNPFAGPASWSFTTADVEPPTIVALNPACGTVNVCPEASICATFSEPIGGASLQPANFLVEKIFPSPAAVPGSLKFSFTNLELCLTPDADLETDSVYRITISGVEDESGLPLAQPFQCEFVSLETVKPFIVSTFPAAGATGILSTVVLTATFSEPLDPTTVGPATVQLVDDAAQAVEGAVSYDPSTFSVAFKPTKKLKLSTAFTATVASTVQDVAGNSAAAPYGWSFVTFNGWGTPEVLETDSAPTTEPRTAIDSSAAITYATWEQKQAGDAFSSIYVDTFLPGTGWTGAVRVSDNLAAAKDPQIAVDSGDGTVHVAWIEKSSGDTKDNVYEANLQGGTGSWSAPLRASNDAAAATVPRLAVDPSSHVPYVCWIMKAGSDTKNNIYANFYTGVPPAWASQARLSDDVEAASAPAIATDPLSNSVYVTWLEKGTGDANNNVYSTFLTAATLPWPAQTRVSDDKGAASSPLLAGDPISGGAFSLWIEKGSGDANAKIYSSLRPDPASPWGAQERASDDSGACSAPKMTLDLGTGTLHAVWVQQAPPDLFNNVYANRYTNGAGPWQSQLRVSTDVSGTTLPDVAADPVSGAAFTVWLMKGAADTNNNVYSSLLPFGAMAWDAPLRASDDSNPAEKPQVKAFTALDSQSALSAWKQKEPPGGR